MNIVNQKKKVYCCNCGKLGHILKTCLEPIISLGIILCSRDSQNKLRFLMIRRKFSLGFMDFVMGKYSIHNIEYIKRIFNEMTIHEKIRILNDDFDTLWFSIDYNSFDFDKILDDDLRKKVIHEYNVAKRKFNLFRHGFINKYNIYTNLSHVIYTSKYNWIEPEWEFPKGKRKMNESNLDAALREFHEETNFPLEDLDIIIREIPFSEKYYGSNMKKYKHIYYIAKTDKMIDYKNSNYTSNQIIEISNIDWLTYDDVMRAIRPYQIEKKIILHNVNTFLNSNSII
jgi:8-oxo-dGTP pyrophosphatase MutT (NUDIX family)